MHPPNLTPVLTFGDAELMMHLSAVTDADLDEVDFGVIGFDSECVVRRYNRFESQCAGLAAERVLGQNLFNVVAPCMNNFMVAQRFEDVTAGAPLDDTIAYVLTLRMRPVKVKLRLLAASTMSMRYVLVDRP